jgi:hypothetical protein
VSSLPAQQNFNANEDTIDNTIAITQDTITFREDGDISTDQYARTMADLPRTLYDTVGDNTERGLKEFLSRPVILEQGNWAVGAASTVSLGSWNFPDAMFTSAYADQITRKLLGFTLMKARIRLRLQVNSQPSYAGILLLSYIPHANYMQNKVASLYSTLTSLSGCTHVTMNLANTTSMEFTTPYISQHLFANLVTGQGTFGRMNLQVMSPLTIGAGTTTPVTWTLWANFEDVELRFPTNGSISTAFAQVGGESIPQKKTGLISGAVGTVGGVIAKTLPALGLGALSQPVEALASSVSGIARFFGFAKPTIQSQPVFIKNYALRGHLNMDGSDTCIKLGASVATELQTLTGFAGTDEDEMNLSYIASRPSIIDTTTWRASATQDTVVATYRVTPTALCWNANNVTPTTPRVRNTEVRNTHAAFLADKYQMWRGDIVYTFHFAKTQLHSGRLRINFKPYVGDLFSAVPSDLNAVPGFTMTEDVDLTTTSCFRFKVPYVSSRPWMLTQWPQWRAPSVTSVDAKNFCIGELEVVVLNRLTNMSTAADTVAITVFAHMENAMFAVPRRSSTLPNLRASPAALAALALSEPEGIVVAPRKKTEWRRGGQTSGFREVVEYMETGAEAQVGGEEAKSMTQTQKTTPVDVLPGAMCQGEVHTSLRQLLKRFELVGHFLPLAAAEPTQTSTGTDGKWYIIRPWAAKSNLVYSEAPLEYKLDDPAATNLSRKYNDTYSAVYGNYAFFRGGMRFRIMFESTQTIEGFDQSCFSAQGFSVFLAYPNPVKPSIDVVNPRAEEHPVLASIAVESNPMRPHECITPLFNVNSTGGGTPLVGVKGAYSREANGWEAISVVTIEGGVEFEVPYYSTGHMSTAVYPQYNGDFWQNQRDGQLPLPYVIFGSNVLPTLQMRVYRAVADDFSFGGLLGVPRSTMVLEAGPLGSNTEPDGNYIEF